MKRKYGSGVGVGVGTPSGSCSAEICTTQTKRQILPPSNTKYTKFNLVNLFSVLPASFPHYAMFIIPAVPRFV